MGFSWIALRLYLAAKHSGSFDQLVMGQRDLSALTERTGARRLGLSFTIYFRIKILL